MRDPLGRITGINEQSFGREIDIMATGKADRLALVRCGVSGGVIGVLATIGLEAANHAVMPRGDTERAIIGFVRLLLSPLSFIIDLNRYHTREMYEWDVMQIAVVNGIGYAVVGLVYCLTSQRWPAVRWAAVCIMGMFVVLLVLRLARLL